MSSGKDDSNSPFSSLSYEILLVFGWYSFCVGAVAETLVLFLKKYYYLYPLGNFLSELLLIIFVTGIESIRIFIGKKGNLTEKPLLIFVSLLLTVPISSGIAYFFWYQTYVLLMDVVITATLFIFIFLQTLFAIFTLISFGR